MDHLLQVRPQDRKKPKHTRRHPRNPNQISNPPLDHGERHFLLFLSAGFVQIRPGKEKNFGTASDQLAYISVAVVEGEPIFINNWPTRKTKFKFVGDDLDEDNEVKDKKEVKKVQKKKKFKQLVEDGVYAIHGYYNGSDMKYLSYNTESGWCRQTYNNKRDGRFKFIHLKDDFYAIQTVYPDKRQNSWLSYGKCEEHGSGDYVGLWTNMAMQAQWKLTPAQFGDHKLAFTFQCYFAGDDHGYLSYQNDGKWNKLYANSFMGSIYVLEKH
eukprot:233280_1